jgi:hypothetical protein
MSESTVSEVTVSKLKLKENDNELVRVQYVRSLSERIQGKEAIIRRPTMGRRADYYTNKPQKLL